LLEVTPHSRDFERAMQESKSAASLASRPATQASVGTRSGMGSSYGGARGGMTGIGTRSMCGSQTLSHKSSAPSFSFGSGPSRLNFTGAAARGDQTLQASVSSGGAVSPGPIYNPAPTSKWLGDAPHVKFGTQEQRPAEGGAANDVSKLTGKSNLPGPGSYPQPSSVGTQPLGRCHSYSKFSFGNQRQRENPGKATASPGPVYEPRGTCHGKQEKPAFSFGNDARLKGGNGSRTPGPGNYGYNSAMGIQVYSTQRSAMTIGFGTPGPGSNRGMLPLEGRASPGPIYMNAGSMRKQAISERKTAHVTAFTRADRFNGPGSEAAATQNNKGPGPGEYIV